jgi:hypothetical protein
MKFSDILPVLNQSFAKVDDDYGITYDKMSSCPDMVYFSAAVKCYDNLEFSLNDEIQINDDGSVDAHEIGGELVTLRFYKMTEITFYK